MKNLAWTRDELLLGLALYFKLEPARLSPTDNAISDLSVLLNRFPLRLGEKRQANYRSPSSVAMKLWNFASLDPNFIGRGLPAGGKADREVWREFAAIEKRSELEHLASSISEILLTSPVLDPSFPLDDQFTEAAEGRILTRQHLVRERNPKLASRKKQAVLVTSKRLCCEVCGFDFEAVYGPQGKGFIECHHIKPLHTLTPGARTRLEDLALLCANCHRMIHAVRPWLTIDGLRAMVKRSNL